MLKYTVSYDKSNLRYTDIEFSADTQGNNTLLFQLPAWRPGRYELGNFAQNIQKWAAYDLQGNILPYKKLSKDLWEVTCKDCETVVIKYNYYSAQLDAGNTYLSSSQLYVNPVNCMLYIPERINEALVLELKIPENYQIASSLSFNNKNIAEVANFHELADSPFIASATLQYETYSVGAFRFHIWFQGICKPDWQKIKDDFWKFTEAQIKLFGEFPVKEFHFLFQMMNNSFHHGVEHLASTVIALGPGYKMMEKDNYVDLLGVSSHELFHCWNIKSIRPIEMFPYDYTQENYSNLGYVAEGVTTYYGDLMLLRSGVYDWEQYSKEMIEIFHRYFYAYGFQYQTLAASSYDTWLDGYKAGAPDRKVNMYVKGMLVAFILDCSLRRDTNERYNLDDVMRALYLEFAKKNKGYSEQDYLNIIDKLSGKSYQSFFEKFIWGLDLIDEPLQYALNYIGLSYKTKEAALYIENKLGLKVKEENCNRTIVNQIAPNSPAEKSGLSIGDEIISARDILVDKNLNEIMMFASDEEVKLMVSRNKNIFYLNIQQGEDSFFPQYELQALEDATEQQKEHFKNWSNQNYPQ